MAPPNRPQQETQGLASSHLPASHIHPSNKTRRGGQALLLSPPVFLQAWHLTPEPGSDFGQASGAGALGLNIDFANLELCALGLFP